MLRVDVDEALPQLAQRGQLHGYVVDESAALARGGDDAREGGLGGVVEVVVGEEGLQAAVREVERPLDGAAARRVLHGRPLVAGAEQQPQGAEQDRLAGARLARDDVRAGVELHFERIDQCVVFDLEAA